MNRSRSIVPFVFILFLVQNVYAGKEEKAFLRELPRTPATMIKGHKILGSIAIAIKKMSEKEIRKHFVGNPDLDSYLVTITNFAKNHIFFYGGKIKFENTPAIPAGETLHQILKEIDEDGAMSETYVVRMNRLLQQIDFVQNSFRNKIVRTKLVKKGQSYSGVLFLPRKSKGKLKVQYNEVDQVEIQSVQFQI